MSDLTALNVNHELITDAKYAYVVIDGMTIETKAGKFIDFTTDKDETIRIALCSGKKGDPLGFERWRKLTETDTTITRYTILPALAVYREGIDTEATAVGYSEVHKQLILLYPATVRKSDGQLMTTDIVYRSRGFSVDRGRNIVDIKVTDANVELVS